MVFANALSWAFLASLGGVFAVSAARTIWGVPPLEWETTLLNLTMVLFLAGCLVVLVAAIGDWLNGDFK